MPLDLSSSIIQQISEWSSGDVFTAEAVNNIEEAVSNISKTSSTYESVLLKTFTGTDKIINTPETFSGNVHSLVTEIKYIQQGEGDPSPTNICPINGTSNITITRTGINIIPQFANETKNGITLINNNGTITLNGTASAQTDFNVSMNFIKLKDSGISFSMFNSTATSSGVKVFIINVPNGNNAEITLNTLNATKTYLADNVERQYEKCKIRISNGEVLNNFTFSPMAVLGTTPSTVFIPSEIQNFSLDLGQTIYNGTIDVVNGNATITHVCETHTWGEVTSGTTLGETIRKTFSLNNQPLYVQNRSYNIQTEEEKCACSIAPYLYSWNNDSIHFYFGSNYMYLWLPVDTPTNTEFTVVYPLHNSLTITLPKKIITSVNGINSFVNISNNINSITVINNFMGEVNKGLESLEGTVSYNEIQNLTDDQKTLARENIDASSSYITESIIETLQSTSYYEIDISSSDIQWESGNINSVGEEEVNDSYMRTNMISTDLIALYQKSDNPGISIFYYDLNFNWITNANGWANANTLAKIKKEYPYVRFKFNKNISTGEQKKVHFYDYIKIKKDSLLLEEDLLNSPYIKKTPNVQGISHRGWYQAPENTLPAFKESRKKGFGYVETDIQFTSDNIPVLLHDSDINRTAVNIDGTAISSSISITDITLSEAREYDFGVVNGTNSVDRGKYSGTQIPTFEEFILLCRNIGLTPEIELKTYTIGNKVYQYTESQITSLVDIVNKYGMKDQVMWCSFIINYLTYIKNYDSKAFLVLLNSGSDITDSIVTTALGLKTAENKVAISQNNTNLTTSGVNKCIAANLPLHLWTLNQENLILNTNPYATMITSDRCNASQVFYNHNIQ